MLLKNILNGTLPIEVLLIKDDAFTSCSFVLKEMLSGFINRKCDVHYLSYERYKYPFVERNSNIKLYDCFSTDCPWFKSNVTQSVDVHSLAETLVKDVPSNQQVFVIDSISYILTTNGIHELSKTIGRLTSVKYKSGVPAFPVILILHDYNEDNTMHRQLEYISNFVAKISGDKSGDKIEILLSHKRSSGKLISENYFCWLEPESGKFIYKEFIDVKVIPRLEDTNISELTTFKLTLEEKEVESRNKLVLPYMRRQGEKGKIFYEPDANDDWDDEDPDDDLEI